MEPRFKVLNFNQLDGSGVRYRIFDKEEPDNPSKHGVFEDKAEAVAICEKLNVEHSE